MGLKTVTIITIMAIAINSFAQTKITVAILDLQAIGVSEAEAISISNRIRNELFFLKQFKVIEREMMQEIFKEQGFQSSGCTSSECVVQAGRILGVQKMVAGSVDKIGILYTLNLRMIEVQTGEIINAASVDCECTIEEVAVNSTKKAVRELLELPPVPEVSVVPEPSPKSAPEFKAPTGTAPKIRKWGIKAGYNLAFFRNVGTSDARNTFCLGGFRTFKWGKKSFFQPELYWTSKGADNGNQEYIIHYLEVPLLLKLRFLTGRQADCYLLLGPFLAFKTYSVVTYKDFWGYTFKELVWDQTEGADIGIVNGYAVEIGKPNPQFYIELRSTWGINDVYRAGFYYSWEHEVYNMSFSVILGVYI